MIDKLRNEPSHSGSPIPNGPVPTHEGPPPKPLTPGLSSSKDRRRNKGIPSRGNLQHRHTHPPRHRPPHPPNHVGPIKPNPVPRVPILSPKPPPQSRHRPHHLRQHRHLKRPDVPGVHKLPKNVPPAPPPHPLPNLIKIRPRDGRKRQKQIGPLPDGGPPLNRPPVMPNEVHRPTHSLNDLDKIPHKLRHAVANAPIRRIRSPTPPHVIPNNPKPPPQLVDHPIPNGRIVRIPVNQQHNRPIDRPVVIHSQPNPTSVHPPSTHKVTVVAPPKTACAKLQPARAHVAQGIEHCPPEAGVAGSNPAVGAPFDQA